MTRLSSFATRLTQSTAQRHLLFLAAALVSILIIGYHFGTFDQFAHLPFLKYYTDPTLFPTDPFIHEMSRQNYSYFWRMFIPVYGLDLRLAANVPDAFQPLLLGTAMLLVHIFATYLTFWAFWTLSLELFGKPLTALFGVLAFIFPHLGFAGFPVLEFSLLNRTFALPFELWAIIFYLRRRYWLAFLIAGIMYNVHIISVNFVMAMFLLDAALRLRTVGWRNVALGLGLFLVGAAPVLIWRLADPPIALKPDPEWFTVMSRGTLYNLFFMIAPYVHIILVTLFGLSALLMFFVARRRVSPPGHDRVILNFVVAVIIILIVQVFTAQFFPITIIIQLQIIRAGLFVTVFGYLYFVHYLLTRYQAAEIGAADFSWLMGATLIAPFPLMSAAVWLLQRWIGPVRVRLAAVVAAVTGMTVLAAVLIIQLNLWAPGLHPFGPRNTWYDAQRWAREHTPGDAIFITPPEKWWLYDSDWRAFSERATVSTLSELLMVALAPSYFPEWQERFEQLAPGAIRQFGGNYFENVDTVRTAFYTLSADDYRRIARRYGATYLVLEKPNARGFCSVYENEQFTIYDLKYEWSKCP